MKTSVYSHDTIGHVLMSLAIDRSRQFVDRLGWELDISADGMEIDRYDIMGTSYVVIEKDGRHFGSCRLRPASLSTMIEDCFLDYLPGASEILDINRDRLFELTRFCRSPDISTEESKAMLPLIGHALEAFRADQGAVGFVAVVYPAVARLMRRNGVALTTLTTGQLADGKKVLMILIGSQLVELGAIDRRCCRTLPLEDPPGESRQLDTRHEQADAGLLPHDELVQLHCVSSQARVATDLAGQEHDLACAA